MACWRAVRRVRRARQHPGQLGRPGRRRRPDRPSVTVVSSDHLLVDHDLGVGPGRHLGQVGDDQHLVVVARSAPATGPRRGAAAPPMPASTSSNTSTGGPSVSTSRRASIARASSPPEATLARGCRAMPGLAAKRNTTSRPAAPPTSISSRAFGQGQVGELGLHRLGQRPGAGARGPPRPRPRAGPARPEARGPLGLEPAPRPTSWPSSSARRCSAGLAPLDHLGEGSPYLRRRSWSSWRRAPISA